MSTNKIRIIIADDHAMFRELLREYLSKKGFLVVEEVSNGLEAVAKCVKIQPDVILLDIDMPLVNGVETAKMIKQEIDSVKIVVLTAGIDEMSYNDLKPLINGFLKKVASLEAIQEAIIKVCRGEKYFLGVEDKSQENIIENDIEEVNSSSSIPELTEREIEVLDSITAGLENKAIAHRLSLSTNTVKYHLKSLFKKFNVNNRLELLREFMKYR